jgi:hypothetical protein
MPGFFDALKQHQNNKVEKQHTVVVDGQKLTVSLETKLKIARHGEANYTLKNGIPVEKPRHVAKQIWPVLSKSDKGYVFYGSDPYWVLGIKEGGYTWQTESE